MECKGPEDTHTHRAAITTLLRLTLLTPGRCIICTTGLRSESLRTGKDMMTKMAEKERSVCSGERKSQEEKNFFLLMSQGIWSTGKRNTRVSDLSH